MTQALVRVGKGRGGLRVSPASLVGGCALVQGTRGSGKSYLVRVMAEQTIAARLQTILLDPEGEYVTLREHLDVLLAGKGRDVPCEARSAKLLARRVAELGISTVIDMSALVPDEQELFVAAFLGALDRLPKSLEASRLVVLDEAHRFCPESGKAKARSTEAVTLLMSQGRKRGLGAILVTQRLSKLRKDAAAEAANLFIGATSPIDLHRAQDLLGVTSAEREALRTLSPGEFYATGPGLSARGVTRFAACAAITTHPEPGTRYKASPPPPKRAVAKLLAELADLPPSLEDEEAASLADAQKRVRALERELAAAKGAAPEVRCSKHAQPLHACADCTAAALAERDEAWRSRVAGLAEHAEGLASLARAMEARAPDPGSGVKRAPTRERTVAPPPNGAATRSPSRSPSAKPAVGGLPGGRFSAMVVALAVHGPLTVQQLALHVGMSAKGGGFRNYLGKGRSLGVWSGSDTIELTEAGHVEAGRVGYDALPQRGAELLEFWCSHPKISGRARDMLRVIAGSGDGGISVEALADAVGMEPSGGGYRNYIGRLRALDLIGRGTPLVADRSLRES